MLKINREMILKLNRAQSIAAICNAFAGLLFILTAPQAAADSAPEYQPFIGDRSSWHDNFARYDFVMDDNTLEIRPFKRESTEGFGIGSPAKGQHRCVVVVPTAPAKGNPWSWRGVYWDHQPQTEIELLRRGFHIAYISASADLKPDRTWDAWYAFLTEKHGLSRKPAFIGMSRGGEYSYTWAVHHPDNVSCIYADNPGGNDEVLSNLGALAAADVPLLHVCGSIDPILGKYSTVIENIYVQFGGRISVMIKEGRGHHPHSLRDPKPIADFIECSVNESRPVTPDFLDANARRQSYYSLASAYQNYPREGTYITCRGPLFTPCYNRYEMHLDKVEAFSTVVVPHNPAPGKPWVFRADFLARDALVDQALLAKGFYIVTGAVPYNGDGPSLSQWNLIYEHLVKAGFSRKPVIEGDGGAAGEAYVWAIANPEKVSCIYAENPLMHGNTAKTQPLDDLAPLAKSGVPIMHVCGSLDPWLAENTRVAEQRYKQLGGSITVLIKEGQGHYPLAPAETAPVVDFIVRSSVPPSKPK